MLCLCASNLEKQRNEFATLNGWDSWDVGLINPSTAGVEDFLKDRLEILEPILKKSDGDWFLEHADVLPRLVALIKDTPRLVSMVEENQNNWKQPLAEITAICQQMELAIEYTELCEDVIGHIDNEIEQCMAAILDIKQQILDSSFDGQISAVQLDHMSKNVYPWLTTRDKAVMRSFCALNDTKIRPLKVSVGFLPDRVTQFCVRSEPVFPSFCALVQMNWNTLEQQWRDLDTEFSVIDKELSVNKWSFIIQLAINQLNDDFEADPALLPAVQKLCNDKNMFQDEIKAVSNRRLSSNSSIFSECSVLTEMSELGVASPKLLVPQFKRGLHLRVSSLDRFSPKPVIKRHSVIRPFQDASSRVNCEELFEKKVNSTPETSLSQQTEFPKIDSITPSQITPQITPQGSHAQTTPQDSHAQTTPQDSHAQSKSYIPVTNSAIRHLNRYPKLAPSTTPTPSHKLRPTILLPKQSLIPLPSPARPPTRCFSTPTRKPRLSFTGNAAKTTSTPMFRSVSDTPVMSYAMNRPNRRTSILPSPAPRASLLSSPVKRRESLIPSTPSRLSGRVSREGIRGFSSRDGMSLANAGVRIVKPIKR